MRFNVQIVMSTTIDWHTLDRVCQSSPIKRLDSKGVGLNSYKGFKEVINTPFVEQYVSVGFAIVISRSKAEAVRNLLPPKTFQLEADDDVTLISYGNLTEWRQAVVAGCDSPMVELFNALYDKFIASGFEDIFQGYKQILSTGHFRLWQST